MKSAFILQTLLLLLFPLNEHQSRTAAGQLRNDPDLLFVNWEPRILVNGSPCLFHVKAARPLKLLSGRWQGRKVFFDFDVASGTWYGFAGVDIDSAPGHHQLALEATLASGARISSRHSVTVDEATYRITDLSVPGKFTEPDPETLARIRQEQELKKVVFRRVSPGRFWSGNFVFPLDSVITGGFGTRRTFNGKVVSVHQGLDFRADPGTHIRAMNNGEVILARELFYEGGFVVIDHGQGLLTLYMHLSEIRVNEGEFVRKGQIIALSGGTGRVTAPHLHIGVRWQGIYLDPAVALTLMIN